MGPQNQRTPGQTAPNTSLPAPAGLTPKLAPGLLPGQILLGHHPSPGAPQTSPPTVAEGDFSGGLKSATALLVA